MLFSDLDRTLIFSKRFVSGENADSLVVAEKISGRSVSYMTPLSFMCVSFLVKSGLFVPVTARKYEEIMRITFLNTNLPEWMISESGRVIYHNNQRVKEWDLQMEQAYKDSMASQLLAQEKFRHILEGNLDCKVWNINKEMVMAKTADLPEEAFLELKEHQAFFEAHQCTLHLQQRKAYLIPKFVTKEDALLYVKNRCSSNYSISAGDAQMDYGMSFNTDCFIAPKHHTIEGNVEYVTKESGIKAGEEIATLAIEVLNNNKKPRVVLAN